MILPEQVIKEARVTEKATELSSTLNQYTFEVYPYVNSVQIKQAVEKLFKVKVKRVNTLKTRGKTKRNRNKMGGHGLTSDIRKAIVTLAEGNKIELV
jgi:large subunit ribosomal protein L23